jgi:membrane protease YdiL (CAAX protease family)
LRTRWSTVKNDLAHARPYWSYEDIGVFFLVLAVLALVLRFFVRIHLLARSELANPSFGLQFAVVASLSIGLYLVLRLRHHQPVLRPLGWIWPHTAYIVVALLGGILLAAGVALYLRFRNQSTPTVPIVELLVLDIALGPILEESFFRGCLLPLLAQTIGNISGVILTAFLFAFFHQPADLVHWISFTVTGVAYGCVRVASRSTTTGALMHVTYNFCVFLSATL